MTLVYGQSSCAALPSIIKGVGLGASYLSSLVDVAEVGSDAYHRRHPSQEREQEIAKHILHARLAVAALNASLSAAEAADSEDVAKAKQDALEAYRALRELLDGLGVLDAVAPAGGAEGSGPEPTPFDLPTADDVGSRL